MIQMSKYIDDIFRRTGMTRRDHPGKIYLSRREIVHLHSWVVVTAEPNRRKKSKA